MGILIVLFADDAVKKLLPGRDTEEKEQISPLSAFIGLTIHCFFNGILLAAFLVGKNVGTLVVICLHKAIVAFSLSSTMIISSDRNSIRKYLIESYLITSMATILSYFLIDSESIRFVSLRSAS